MRKTSRFVVGLTATMAAMLAGSSASATITAITLTGDARPSGFTLITDFNSANGTTINDLAAGYFFDQDVDAFKSYIRDGSLGLDDGQSAPPPLNNTTAAGTNTGVTGTWYETVEAGGVASLTSTRGLKAFSFYMGSPDEYNSVSFYGAGGNLITTLNGNALWGGVPAPGTGDQTLGYTVKYDFGTDKIFKIAFASSDNSFEFDKLAGISAVPESSTWAMMILGIGGTGMAMRSRRRTRTPSPVIA